MPMLQDFTGNPRPRDPIRGGEGWFCEAHASERSPTRNQSKLTRSRLGAPKLRAATVQCRSGRSPLRESVVCSRDNAPWSGSRLQVAR